MKKVLILIIHNETSEEEEGRKATHGFREDSFTMCREENRVEEKRSRIDWRVKEKWKEKQEKENEARGVISI